MMYNAGPYCFHTFSIPLPASLDQRNENYWELSVEVDTLTIPFQEE